MLPDKFNVKLATMWTSALTIYTDVFISDPNNDLMFKRHACTSPCCELPEKASGSEKVPGYRG